MTVEASTSVMMMSSCSSGCPVRLDHDCEMAFIRFWRTARERPARTVQLMSVVWVSGSPAV